MSDDYEFEDDFSSEDSSDANDLGDDEAYEDEASGGYSNQYDDDDYENPDSDYDEWEE